MSGAGLPFAPTVTVRLSPGFTATVPVTDAPSPPATAPRQETRALPPVPPTAVIVTLVTPGGTVTVDVVAGVVDENNIVEAAADPTSENPTAATSAATNDTRPTLIAIPNPFLRYLPRLGEDAATVGREGLAVAEAPTGAAANEAMCATRPAESSKPNRVVRDEASPTARRSRRSRCRTRSHWPSRQPSERSLPSRARSSAIDIRIHQSRALLRSCGPAGARRLSVKRS